MGCPLVRISKNRRFLSFLLTVPVLVVSSCSGSKKVINCSGIATCVNNNGSVSLVLTATPPDPSLQLSIQSFSVSITGISLTPTTGSDVALQINSNPYIAELNRVTSDSTIVAAGASVPEGSYTQVKVTFSALSVTYCTNPASGTPGCTAGSLASVSGAAGSASFPVNFSLAVNQRSGMAINVNLGNALTLTGQKVTAVNLGANNVFKAALLPPAPGATDLASSQLSHVDDVMGTISAVNGSVITLQTASRGDIIATANSSTQFATSCANPSVTGCVKVNDVAIIDAVLNTDGTLTLVFYQPLFGSSMDLIEGVVTAVPDSVNNKLTVAVTDSVFASSASVLSGQLHFGDQVTATLASAQPFSIVSKGLNVPANSFVNSTSITDVQPGQTVAFPVSAYVAQSGATPGSTTTNTFLLRFTRISGTAGAPALPSFPGTNLPPYFGITSSQQFQTTSGRLSLDGISSLGSLQAGSTFSTSALYLGPPASPLFAAQTLRAR